MTITYDKKLNAARIEGKEGVALFMYDKIATPDALLSQSFEGIDMLLVVPENYDPFNGDHILEWARVTEKMLKEKTLLVFSHGEYRIKDLHMKGIKDSGSLQFVIESPECTVGVLTTKPSESFVRKYVPLDVIIGPETALADIQLDFEPFFVVLTQMTPAYMQQTGVTEINETGKVTVKKIDPLARESTIDMSVSYLK
ncbi:MAG: hypothetical protein QY314_03460 [Candidatus Dojkabacteria bacterium]|nr:MAG: hypothetical protein QY314_03460 [Candidatus Dojkabacteria bacterium]